MGAPAPSRKSLRHPLGTHALVQTKKCTKRQLFSLIGKLHFTSKVMPAGRIFLRRLIDLSTYADAPHHHLYLNSVAKANIRWWRELVPSWNGTAPILELNWTLSNSINLYTDASAKHGFGAFYNGAWLRGPWLQHQQINNSPKISIAWQELYAIMVAAMAWGHLWYGQRILFHCDNLAVVDIWRKHSSKIPYIMCLIRNLYFIAASNHFHVCVFHIQGVNNTIADALSRNKTHHLLVPGPKYRKNHDSRSKACISALTREATAWANNSLAHQQPASTPQQTDTRSNSATNYTSTHIQPPKTFCLFSHVT